MRTQQNHKQSLSHLSHVESKDNPKDDSKDNFEDYARAFVAPLAVTAADVTRIAALEQRTEDWHRERRKRLTASNFGTAVQHSANETPNALLKKMVWPELRRFGGPACQYGTEHEDDAESMYLMDRAIARDEDPSLPEVTMRHTGLVVSQAHPWLAASPDGIILEDGKPVGIFEAKCPFGASYAQAMCGGPRLFYSNRDYKTVPADRPFPKLRTGKKHKTLFHENVPSQYYDQVIGQCAILGLPFADFVVWTRTATQITRVPFCRDYWENELFPALRDFYFNKYLPTMRLREEGELVHGTIRKTET